MIACCASGSGIHNFIQHNDSEIKCKYVSINDYRFVFRKRMEDELNDIRMRWKDTSHLMACEGYINKIKDDVICAQNPEFPRNFIKAIIDADKVCDTVLVDDTPMVYKILKQNKLLFVRVLPEKKALEAWIGRLYLEGKRPIFIDELIENWEGQYKVGKDILTYYLKSNEYLSPAILKTLQNSVKLMEVENENC